MHVSKPQDQLLALADNLEPFPASYDPVPPSALRLHWVCVLEATGGITG